MVKDEMIKIGLTEMHGIAKEVAANPPVNVTYIEAKDTRSVADWFFTSPAIGVLRYFKGKDCDILEAPLFPVITNQKWIYTPARFSGATAFEILNIPLPRFIRVFLIKQLMLRKNFIKLIFKSHAGSETLRSFAGITDKRILDKVDVVYPCMRQVDDKLIRYNQGKVNFMCSGDFFLKGSANVVDAFIRLAKEYDHIHLRICASNDMRIHDKELQQEYRDKIENHPRITFGAVERDVMLNEVLPETDVFVSPTYQEAFGFAILEASAYGLPVIATKHFAIPEIIEDGESGFLVDNNHFDFIKNGKVCVLDTIPTEFMNFMVENVLQHMKFFIDNPAKIELMGNKGLQIARTKFSFTERNKKMLSIYQKAME
jgi:glycosyltransferase involved in cell wall biosynthesis